MFLITTLLTFSSAISFSKKPSPSRPRMETGSSSG